MNYAIYAMFTGDLKIAETEARTALELGKGQYKAYLPLAAVAFALGRYGRHAHRVRGHAGYRRP